MSKMPAQSIRMKNEESQEMDRAALKIQAKIGGTFWDAWLQAYIAAHPSTSLPSR